MKIKILFILVLVCLLISACSVISPTVIASSDGGKIISAVMLATSFNTPDRTIITTASGIYVVDNFHSLKIGAQTEIHVLSNGTKCLFVEGENSCWELNK
jgi:hypothetical protein